jgi:hypothetical protein
VLEGQATDEQNPGVPMRQESKPTEDGQPKPDKRGKLSLYGLSIEDALRAAAKTGRPPPLESQKPKRQRQKLTKAD